LRAAKEAKPFCEICEYVEEEVEKELIQMYCIIDNKEGETVRLNKLPIGKEFTLCIETKGFEEGEEVTVDMTDDDRRTYKNGEKVTKLTGTVEVDGVVYIDGVKIEFNKQSYGTK